jgi:hypothetical protein
MKIKIFKRIIYSIISMTIFILLYCVSKNVFHDFNLLVYASTCIALDSYFRECLCSRIVELENESE